MAKLFDMGRKPLKESLAPTSIGQEKPSPYAYEHKISLNAEDLSKLGVDNPQVGDEFHVLARGHVTSAESTASENGKKATQVSLQLKQMAVRKHGSHTESLLGAVSKGIDDAKGE